MYLSRPRIWFPHLSTKTRSGTSVRSTKTGHLSCGQKSDRLNWGRKSLDFGLVVTLKRTFICSFDQGTFEWKQTVDYGHGKNRLPRTTCYSAIFRFPVLNLDRLRVLRSVKREWGSRLVRVFPIWHWFEVKEITTHSLALALPIHLFYGRMNGREKKMNASFERGECFQSPL